MRVGLLLVAVLALANGFYLPGVAPRNYLRDEPVDLKVNAMDSIKTQLPFDFYSLPFCQPATITEAAENLGEIMSGDVIETSSYNIRMKKLEACQILCKKEYTADELRKFASKIHEEYLVNFLIDNVPAGQKYYYGAEGEAVTEENAILQKGFPLGFIDTAGKAMINNHVRLVLSYHEDPDSFDGYRIVGFLVQPSSIKHSVDGTWLGATTKLNTCNALVQASDSGPFQPVEFASEPTGKTEIIFTYDVQWEPSAIKWASRWDLYLKMTNSSIHWWSIMNSIFVVLILSMIVALIMIRTLKGDLQKYNDMEIDDDPQEETGWKLIHGDVFRPPQHASFLCVLLGTGYQLNCMVVATLTFACLGFLSPANRGGLMNAFLILFVLLGVVSGYLSTRTYKMFGMTEWKTNTMWTAIFFPGVCFAVFFILDLFLWNEGSTAAVPFGTLMALLLLWLGISAPLVYLGSYFAFKKDAIKPPTRVNNIPRLIPTDTPWYHSPLLYALVGGALPFGACFIEVFFIMNSVWQHQFYYMFGILAIVFLILIITCAEISICLIYFQLCAEDYHWWWISFFTGGCTSVYLFLYSVYHFCTRLEIVKFISVLMYFSYMLVFCFAFFILMGTIGFTACYIFVRKIYSSVKVD